MLIEKFLNLYQQLNAIKNEIKRDEPLPDDNVPKVQKVKIISNAANRSSTKFFIATSIMLDKVVRG